METTGDTTTPGDLKQSQLQIAESETLKVLRGIHGLLERINRRLEDHGKRLTDIEERSGKEEAEGKGNELHEASEQEGKTEKDQDDREEHTLFELDVPGMCATSKDWGC